MKASWKRVMISQDYFLLLISRFISQLGDKMFIPAILWLSLTGEDGSSQRLGIVSVALVIAPLVSALVGVYVDRLPKKTVMIVSDLLRFLLCVMLFLNQWQGGYFWFLVVGVVLIEIIGQFFALSSASMLPSLVKKEELIKANSFFSTTDTLTSLIGYSLGGVLITLLGSSMLILLNGVSFALSGLLLVGLPKAIAAIDKQVRIGFFQEFASGLRFTFRSRLLLNLLMMGFILNTVTASLEMLVTIWSYDVLDVGATGYGLLNTLIMVGALVGGLSMNLSFMKQIGVAKLYSGMTVIFGSLFALMALFDTLWVSVCAFLMVGICFSVTGVSFSTLVMTHVGKSDLGKIFGLINTVSRGGQPLGISLVTALLLSYSVHSILFSIGAIIALGGVYLLLVLVPTAKSTAEVRSEFN